MTPALIISILTFCIALVACIYALVRRRESAHIHEHYHLERHGKNPIISPLPHREWELGGTFNPAAIYDDEGRVHILYRAIGADGISRLGYASSSDGLNFTDRSSYPVYQPSPGYGMPDPKNVSGPHEYNPAVYTSGGGWGGCEDPRLVRIGDRVYMTYVAFEGWDSVRMALTSIGLKDFKKGKWNWKRPRLISAAGEVNKNWVLFPEKINGKFAILHGITPNILIDYVDNIENSETIKSIRPKGGRKDFWDNWVRGAGPPPIKTDKGWLLLYHAMDTADPNKYKLGAMILDINDPTKILCRSPLPILSPEKHYENDGKPGVVYASGAIVKDGDLFVYYGGGDRHVCVAQTPLNELLGWLMEYGKVS